MKIRIKNQVLEDIEYIIYRGFSDGILDIINLNIDLSDLGDFLKVEY
jgi:hypothetical protein